MFKVNYVNEDDGGELSKFASFDEAKDYCRWAFQNGDVDEGDRLQIWNEADDSVAVAEFTPDDLKISNQELREMARVALDNWAFDEETDPNGDVKRGLEHLAAEGDWDQEVIDGRFDHLRGLNGKWDVLEEWAGFLGQR